MFLIELAEIVCDSHFSSIARILSLTSHLYLRRPLQKQRQATQLQSHTVSRIRIRNIIPFKCDPLLFYSVAHRTHKDSNKECYGRSAYPPVTHTNTNTHTKTRTHTAPAARAAKLQFERRQGREGGGGLEGQHTMERAADQRSGEIELEIFHGWLA